MKLHEAIDAVSKFYIVGAVAFYDQLKPNPWQQICDDMDNGIIDCDQYVFGLKNLCDQYLKMRTNQPKDMTNSDAFYLADEDRVKKWHSTIHRLCIQCGRSYGKQKSPKGDDDVVLKLRPVIGSTTEVELICNRCL